MSFICLSVSHKSLFLIANKGYTKKKEYLIKIPLILPVKVCISLPLFLKWLYPIQVLLEYLTYVTF